MAQNSEAKKNGKVSLVVYDFDQTITCDHLYHRLAGGQVDELEKMSDEKLKEIFGGEIRIERLKKHFERVRNSGAGMAIVSYGYVDVIQRSLERMGLAESWTNCAIVGCDSQELVQVGGRKAAIIENLRTRHQLTSNQVLFVDDDPTNIRQATVANCSLTLGISPRRGMTENHMCDIEKQLAVVVTGQKNNDSEKEKEEEQQQQQQQQQHQHQHHPETLSFQVSSTTNHNVHENESTSSKHHSENANSNGFRIVSPRTNMNYSFNHHKTIAEQNNTSSFSSISASSSASASVSIAAVATAKENNNEATVVVGREGGGKKESQEEKQSKEKGKSDETRVTSTTNTNERNHNNRTDWSKYTVTVPKKLENMWNRDRDNSDTPVVHIKSDSLNSDDDESGPTLELPLELPITHS